MSSLQATSVDTWLLEGARDIARMPACGRIGQLRGPLACVGTVGHSLRRGLRRPQRNSVAPRSTVWKVTGPVLARIESLRDQENICHTVPSRAESLVGCGALGGLIARAKSPKVYGLRSKAKP